MASSRPAQLWCSRKDVQNDNTHHDGLHHPLGHSPATASLKWMKPTQEHHRKGPSVVRNLQFGSISAINQAISLGASSLSKKCKVASEHSVTSREKRQHQKCPEGIFLFKKLTDSTLVEENLHTNGLVPPAQTGALTKLDSDSACVGANTIGRNIQTISWYCRRTEAPMHTATGDNPI